MKSEHLFKLIAVMNIIHKEEGIIHIPGMELKKMYGYRLTRFYSNKVIVNKDFETSIKGLRAIGDGAGVTRGLQQASANGLSVARSIIKSL